jgi:hypothetical protein
MKQSLWLLTMKRGGQEPLDLASMQRPYGVTTAALPDAASTTIPQETTSRNGKSVDPVSVFPRG